MNFVISNNKIKISVKSFGAELCSLKTANDDFEYLWQGDKKYWARHSPVLFPIVGKLIDNEYFYKDKKYQMNQHGFARDMEFEVLKKENDFLSFILKSNEETLRLYPFHFELIISYKLDEDMLIIAYEILNKNSFDMPFSIGAHPAFNWPFDDGKKDEYYFEFKDTNILSRLPLTTNGININSESIKLEENKMYLNEKLFENDAIILQNLENKTIELKNLNNKRKIKVDFDDFEYLGLWSKPTGSAFICIEPWNGIADFINHNKKLEDKKAIRILKKNEFYRCKYSIKI